MLLYVSRENPPGSEITTRKQEHIVSKPIQATTKLELVSL
ncbi:unnamed protein product [Arabidopsis halleri]